MAEYQITNIWVWTVTESRLSSTSLTWITIIFHQTLAASIRHTIHRFIQEGLNEVSSQDKLVVSNHHSKCLSNGKITMMEICSKSDADPSYHQPLDGDLISNMWEGKTWLFQLVITKFLDHDFDSQGKMRGWRLSLPWMRTMHIIQLAHAKVEICSCMRWLREKGEWRALKLG